MVVKNEKSVETIRETLKRLESYFLTNQAQDAERFVLSDIESKLIRIERDLYVFGNYRPKSS